ncbi:hypothetical protein BGZ63DRAFT_401474 [Mariannaea sp. PMI_226]|nr:hypothetical protein BGZ63DRAFT_401474 [Mariannaea sp. PMI_226]
MASEASPSFSSPPSPFPTSLSPSSPQLDSQDVQNDQADAEVDKCIGPLNENIFPTQDEATDDDASLHESERVGQPEDSSNGGSFDEDQIIQQYLTSPNTVDSETDSLTLITTQQDVSIGDRDIDKAMGDARSLHHESPSDKPESLLQTAVGWQMKLRELLELSGVTDLKSMKSGLSTIVDGMTLDLLKFAKRDSLSILEHLQLENDELRQTIESLTESQTTSHRRTRDRGRRDSHVDLAEEMCQNAWAALDDYIPTRSLEQEQSARVGPPSRPTVYTDVESRRWAQEWEEPRSTALSRPGSQEPDTPYSANFKKKLRYDVQSRFMKNDPDQPRQRSTSNPPMTRTRPVSTKSLASIIEGSTLPDTIRPEGRRSQESSPGVISESSDMAVALRSEVEETPLIPFDGPVSLLDEGIDELDSLHYGDTKSSDDSETQLLIMSPISRHSQVSKRSKHASSHQEQELVPTLSQPTRAYRIQKRRYRRSRRRLRTALRESKAQPKSAWAASSATSSNRQLIVYSSNPGPDLGPSVKPEPEFELRHESIPPPSAQTNMFTNWVAVYNKGIRLVNRNKVAVVMAGITLYLVFVIATLQVWNSCRRQQRIWFEANGLTREYMLKRFRAGDTWLGGWGIDPDLFYSAGEVLRQLLAPSF